MLVMQKNFCDLVGCANSHKVLFQESAAKVESAPEERGTLSTSHNVSAILERAGFVLRGNRASCPFCTCNRKLTVAIHGEVFFCHHCKRGGHIRSLARRQGISLPPLRVRKASIPKNRFRGWLSRKVTELGNEERKAFKKLEWAFAALYFDADFEPAWNFLAWFYCRECVWREFWISATDRLGRFWMYRAWRKYAAR